jgi:CDP-glycerol glycerophosphotransferase
MESGTAIGCGDHDIAYERILIGRFRIIQTWHGSPLKRINLDALDDRENPGLVERLYKRIARVELGRLQAVIALSNADAHIFESAFRNQSILQLGYPKNDMLVDGLGAWGIEPRYNEFKKVVLYAPTFRDHSDALRPFTSDFLQELNDAFAEKNWCFLVKKHPYDRGLEIPAGLDCVRDVSGEEKDIQELLAQVDLLVTDYSSVFVDFLLRDKAQIAYVYDFDEYLERSRGMYYDLHEVMPGRVVKTEQELLERMLDHETWYASAESEARRKDALSRFHRYRDGRSCHRLTRYLESGIAS